MPRVKAIHIRRMPYEEARAKLEQELQDAFLSGERYVEIVHGIGGGVLRDMAHEVVRNTDFLRILPEGTNPGVLRAEVLSPGKGEIKKYLNRS